MSTANRRLVDEYMSAISESNFDRLGELIHPDATFGGTVGSVANGREAFVQGFRNLSLITVRSDVREIIVDDDHAAVLYDFVTDTPVGAVLCAEFLTFKNGLIKSSTLVLDWRRWPEVISELQTRNSQSGQVSHRRQNKPATSS